MVALISRCEQCSCKRENSFAGNQTTTKSSSINNDDEDNKQRKL